MEAPPILLFTRHRHSSDYHKYPAQYSAKTHVYKHHKCSRITQSCSKQRCHGGTGIERSPASPTGSILEPASPSLHKALFFGTLLTVLATELRTTLRGLLFTEAFLDALAKKLEPPSSVCGRQLILCDFLRRRRASRCTAEVCCESAVLTTWLSESNLRDFRIRLRASGCTTGGCCEMPALSTEPPAGGARCCGDLE